MAACNRRDFLKKSGGALGAVASGGLSMGATGAAALSPGVGGAMADRADWSGFKYAMCNESLQERSWREQCQIIGEAGYTGVEIAPFTLVEQGVQEIGASERKELARAMEEAGLECVGLHWLLAPPPEGLHFTTPDEAVRQKAVAYLDRLIDFCGDLGGTVMVFGSPNQRSATGGLSVQEAQKRFAEGLSQVADHALARGVLILVEPLGSDQTGVVNTLASAMEVVRQVHHPAIQTMFDFHNTVDETQPMHELIEQHYANLFHVHVQEMDGTYLGTGDAVEDYVQTFQALKDLGYARWISLEVFDFSPGGKTIAQESMKTLKQIEAKLT